MSFQASPANQGDYTSGRPTNGYDRASDSTTSSVSAADDLASIQARLNLMSELTYSMPQADAGAYVDRVQARWFAPASVKYGNSPGDTNRIDFSIDFAGHYPDISTHYFCFRLKTFRIPGACPTDPNDANRLISARRYSQKWDAHHNNPSLLMRIAHLHRLLDRYRITTSGGSVIEEADNVDLACEIRLRAQSSQPTPRVHSLFCPAPLPGQTAVVDSTGYVTRNAAVPGTLPAGRFTDDYASGFGAGAAASTSAGTYGLAVPNVAGGIPNNSLSLPGMDYLYHYNPPSCIVNSTGCLPLQTTLLGASATAPAYLANANAQLAGLPIVPCYAAAGGVDPERVFSLNTQRLELGSGGANVEQSVRADNDSRFSRQYNPLVGYWRPVVLDSFRERGWHGVDMLDDVELMFQLCSNVVLPMRGATPNDGTEIGRLFKMKLPCQFMNRQPILPDIKNLRFELYLQNVDTAFQGVGSAPSYQTHRLPQNEMHPEVSKPADWWFQLTDVSLEMEVVDLAPTLRASIQKGMNEGGLPLHWTQWSYAGDSIGTAETFTHNVHRNVANVVAAVSVFTSPKSRRDWRWDSYRFMNPNLMSAQWHLGTSMFPPVALEGSINFFTSLRQCFPVPADTLGRIDRLEFEGERALNIEGSFFSYLWAAPVTQLNGASAYAGAMFTNPSDNATVRSLVPNLTNLVNLPERMVYDSLIGGVNMLNGLAQTPTVEIPCAYRGADSAHSGSAAEASVMSVVDGGSAIPRRWGVANASNVSHGFRGVVSLRTPSSFILARCFQTARGIDLTGLSTLQGQQLMLKIQRYSGTVNLTGVRLDFDPGARHVFIIGDSPGTTPAGCTTAGVSSLYNLSRDLYIPFTALWECRADVGAVTTSSVVNSVVASALIFDSGVPAAGCSVQQMLQSAAAVSSGTQAAAIGFVDLSAVPGYLSGTDGRGFLDFRRCLQNRNSTTSVAAAPDNYTVWNGCVADDLAIQTFVLHTKIVLLGTMGNVTSRE